VTLAAAGLALTRLAIQHSNLSPFGGNCSEEVKKCWT